MKITLGELRAMAASALGRMYRPEERVYAFRLKRTDAGIVPEGVSPRYTAITLLALAEECDEVVGEALCGQGPQDVCRSLLKDIDRRQNLGDTALALWAARALRMDDAGRVLKRLQALDPVDGDHPTVEVAWSLSALTIGGGRHTDEGLAHRVAQRLRNCCNQQTFVFAHTPPRADSCGARSHVACFADFVYPVQALAFYGASTGERWALDAARGGAERMCRTQGPAGQWWWHFDVRTGNVIEGYPVYAVHQDAMAPMALFAAGEACRADFSAAAYKGMDWLYASPELNGGSLIDVQEGVIWRKVCRHEPGKLARILNAAASRVHPALRFPGVNMILPPGRVDWESRPYHMAWLLYAWRREAVRSSPAPARQVAAAG